MEWRPFPLREDILSIIILVFPPVFLIPQMCTMEKNKMDIWERRVPNDLLPPARFMPRYLSSHHDFRVNVWPQVRAAFL